MTDGYFPFAAGKKRKFVAAEGENFGVYVAEYQGEGVCKIGVSCTPRDRLRTLRSHTWVPVRISSFYFAFKPASELSSLSDDYNILKSSAYALEALCHAKLKDLGVHLAGEFFEIFHDEADLLVRKVAEIEGFRVCTPSQILNSGVNIENLSDERLAFFQMANAAGVAIELMRDGFGS